VTADGSDISPAIPIVASLAVPPSVLLLTAPACPAFQRTESSRFGAYPFTTSLPTLSSLKPLARSAVRLS
jgi:hypothetical protein